MCVGGGVRVRVCRIYIHWLLLLEAVTVLLVGIEVYASFDQVLDQTQAELLCDS